MIGRLVRYTRMSYPPAVYLPYMVLWAAGLTALAAGLTGSGHRRWLGPSLAGTAVTLVVDMLMLRALDDLRDHEYDRIHHPGRPLPSGIVRQRDLLMLVAAGTAVVLGVNATRGWALAVVTVHLVYAGVVMVVDRYRHWPPGERPFLHLAVNMPIQTLLSAYVYVAFLHSTGRRPGVAGVVAVGVATLVAISLEFGRKVSRTPAAGEHTYSAVLGGAGTSAVAVASAVAAVAVVLAALAPWRTGDAVAWLVVAPLLLPGWGAVRFARGAKRWPVLLIRSYVPATYSSLLAVGWLVTGGWK